METTGWAASESRLDGGGLACSYAAENSGWVDFEPNIVAANVGATVSEEELTGFIWAKTSAG